MVFIGAHYQQGLAGAGGQGRGEEGLLEGIVAAGGGDVRAGRLQPYGGLAGRRVVDGPDEIGGAGELLVRLEELCQDELFHTHAGGKVNYLGGDNKTLLFEREGDVAKKGLITMINGDDTEWRGQWVKIRKESTRLVPAAWWGKDMSRPIDKVSSPDGWVDLYAPPRGYVVYKYE